MDLISSLSMDTMAKALDGLAQRQTAIASNIANVDTPNYQRKTVSFEDDLKRAVMVQKGMNPTRQANNDMSLPMKATSSQHLITGPLFSSIDEVQPQMMENRGAYRTDGNGVDVESEMAQLSKNTEHYLALSHLEAQSFKNIKSVINSGG